jgi:hypothetical protein
MNMGADKKNTQPERRPEGKEGAGSHQEGKNPVQAANLSVESTLSPRRTSRILQTTTRRPYPGRSNTGPRRTSIRMLGATKAARDRTWMRVALPAPRRSPVTAATIVAEVEHQNK